MAGYYTGMACGATIAYAESVETVRDNMLEVRPTIVTTVPRLFERIYSRVIKQVDAGSPLKKKIFYWGIDVGHRLRKRRAGGTAPFRSFSGSSAPSPTRSSTRKLRERTGGRMRFFVSGGAALGKEFGEFFEAVGLTDHRRVWPHRKLAGDLREPGPALQVRVRRACHPRRGSQDR